MRLIDVIIKKLIPKCYFILLSMLLNMHGNTKIFLRAVDIVVLGIA